MGSKNRIFHVYLISVLIFDGEATTASHKFSPLEAEVFWSPSGIDDHQLRAHSRTSSRALRREKTSLSRYASSLTEQVAVGTREDQPLRILHITDNHISIDDPDPPHTSRMYNAFAQISDHFTHRSSSPQEEFRTLVRMARDRKVDLIALGGDLVNYPSSKTVAFVLDQLGDIPFIYTAGNHDWHEEGLSGEKRYDSQRLFQLNSTLRPLFERSVAALGTSGPQNHLYGKTSMKGVDVFFIDNSNFQINQEQLDYFKTQIQRDSHSPAVLLMHMPLKLDKTPPLPPKHLCGHPDWGYDTDDLYDIEGRPRWPKGNDPSTLAFIDLVRQHSAPTGRLVALLTGHVHEDFSTKLQDGSLPYAGNLTALACGKAQPGCMLSSANGDGTAKGTGALQYTTLCAATGGYRLLTVRHNSL